MFLFKIHYLSFGCTGSSCWAWAFSGCNKRGLRSVSVRGLPPGGFSCWGAQSLGGVGLVALRHEGSSRSSDQTCVSCTGRRILTYGTTKEVPHLLCDLTSQMMDEEKGTGGWALLFRGGLAARLQPFCHREGKACLRTEK